MFTSVCLDRSRREPPEFSQEAVPAILALWLSRRRGEPIWLERLCLGHGLAYKGTKTRNLKSQETPGGTYLQDGADVIYAGGTVGAPIVCGGAGLQSDL